MRTALVTGASGQVGARLLDRLEATGWSARGFDIRAGDDLRDERAVLAAAAGCDAIIHVEDVLDATLRALDAEVEGHIRVTLCGPGDFDTSLARETLGWKPLRSWPKHS